MDNDHSSTNYNNNQGQMFHPPKHVVEKAYIKSMEQYRDMYLKSTKDEASCKEFWADVAKNNFYWKEMFTNDQILSYNFAQSKGKVFVEWFKDGVTNICYNCLDRHLPHKSDHVAFYYEPNEVTAEDARRPVTFGELYENVTTLAHALRTTFGVKKGDTVAIYLPMTPEVIVAMLACARIGAIHSVIFAGFSSESLANRLIDSEARLLITADAVARGPSTKLIQLKEAADLGCEIARQKMPENATYKGVEKMIVFQRFSKPGASKWDSNRDVWLHDVMKTHGRHKFKDEAQWKREQVEQIAWLNAEDPLFMLYTSGSTGQPKGLVHTTGGYMVYAATTFKYIFDYHEDDIYFCTADCGWITGHTYVLYGPLLNGATQVLFEGIPTYPDAGRLWEIVDEYKVTQFYTAPTAIRALMKFGDQFVNKYSRKTLRILGSVGEPINPEAWLWYYNIVGNANVSIVDTYWQTETGGIVITPLPVTPQKPGSATLPFFGIQPVVLHKTAAKDENPESTDVVVEGFLGIKFPWPGMARTVYRDHARYEQTYFSAFDGYYITGDGCKRDNDGYYWLTGRIDDVLNVSGHRLGTAEIESALVSHPACTEAAVVPVPHDIKGQGIYAYVTIRDGYIMDNELKLQLNAQVRKVVGPIASVDVIHWAPQLPKTRSGKIMRRILRKIAEGIDDIHQLGDLTTLADITVVQELIARKGQ